MRVLVTGGMGFIGSHLVDRLLKAGYEVRVLDSVEPKVHPNGTPSYVPNEAEVIQGDVRNKSVWARALRKVEIIFHQAAYQDYMPDYSTFFSTNATSTALMFEVINEQRFRIQKILVASSQAVYGEGQYECETHGFVQPPARPLEQLARGDWEMRCPTCLKAMKPLRLTEEFANPYNQYAISKYSQELAAIRIGRLLGIPSVVLRYSITQGPRQSLHNQYSGICRIFTVRLLNDQPPIIFEDGLQTRDVVHVDDVIEANMLVLKRDEANFEVFNVGSGEPKTVLAYAELLTKKLGKTATPLLRGEYRVGDNRHSVSDIQKLKKLGWQPQKSLEDICEDYLAWIDSFADIKNYFSEADKIMRRDGVIRQACIN